jgi:hypothetical protein
MNKFDELSKSLAQCATSRQALKKFAAGLLGMALVCSGVFAQAPGPGSALSFDGTGAYVAIATTGSLTGTFTVELWARPNEPNLAVALVGSRAPSEYGFDAKFMRGAIVHADIGDGSGWLTSGADGYLPYIPGEWHHVAYVVTPTIYNIYGDGLLIGSGPVAGNALLYDQAHELRIGWDWPAAEFMKGEIDEVRIWNIARNANEIQANMCLSLTGTETGLMGYWRCDEGSGATLTDASGHGFNGTLVSTLGWVNSTAPIGSQPCATAQLCPAGYYSSNGLLPCVPAPPGYYVPTTGATNLTPATPGSYVPGFAATNQVQANAGTYCPWSGMSAAIPAPPGYFAPSAGASNLISAEAGYYAPGFGNIQATPAPKGTYAPFAGMSSNIPAPPGYFVPSPGSTELTPASPGHVVPTPGASVQIQAVPGEWAPIPGMASPLPAFPGYFVPGFGSTDMTPAPIGSYVPGVGSVWYSTPLYGRYAPVAGMSDTIAAGDLDGDGSVTQSELNATLTNYWPNSPWLSMTNFGEQCGGEFQFALTNASAWNFSVLYSTNLAATNWDYLGIAYPVYHFKDPTAIYGAPQRFYRLRWP